MEFNNNEIKRKNPINRNNLFFSEEDFQFEINMGKSYIEHDLNQTIILYEVDLEKTKLNNTYREANKNEISFKTPVELNVIYELDEAELLSYDKKQLKAYYLKTGKFHFGIFEKTLEEMECDIKRGDYIGLQVTPEHIEYFTVVNDGKKNYDNEHTMFGYKPYYRSIECAVIDQNEFNGI